MQLVSAPSRAGTLLLILRRLESEDLAEVLYPGVEYGKLDETLFPLDPSRRPACLRDPSLESSINHRPWVSTKRIMLLCSMCRLASRRAIPVHRSHRQSNGIMAGAVYKSFRTKDTHNLRTILGTMAKSYRLCGSPRLQALTRSLFSSRFPVTMLLRRQRSLKGSLCRSGRHGSPSL